MEINNLSKVSDILNAEGSILSLFLDTENKLYLAGLLNDGSGTVYFEVTDYQLKGYLHSNVLSKQICRSLSLVTLMFTFYVLIPP